jgi:hypothetical protein
MLETRKKRGKNTIVFLPPTLCHEKALHDKSKYFVEKYSQLDGNFFEFFLTKIRIRPCIHCVRIRIFF